MKPQPRGTGCVNCARPDQWGASSGLRAGRPYPGSIHADSFGSGAFTMDFVTIGNAGNAADDTTYGSVGYSYRIGVNEVSERMIDAYNASAVSWCGPTGG